MPTIGDFVDYIPRPGQIRAGAGVIAALVTAEGADGRLTLLTFPPNSEPVEHDKVLPLSGTVTGHCWRERKDEAANLRREVAELRALIEDVTAPKKSKA